MSKIFFSCLWLLVASVFCEITFTQTTIAGVPVNSGDGGLATQATLYQPTGIFVAPSSNDLYIVDNQNSQLRKVSASSGIISTVAGMDGIPSYSANASYLNFPTRVYVTRSNIIYITDTNNHLVRTVSSTGVMTTIAGIPQEAGYTPDGVLASKAKLSSPNGITVDEQTGEVYFSEVGNCVIRKILSNGTLVTVAGTAACGFNGKSGVSTEVQLSLPSGIFLLNTTLYVADYGNHLIRKFDLLSGITSPAVGDGFGVFRGDGGDALQASISYPADVTIVPQTGDMFIADSYNHVVRRVDGATNIISTVAGIPGSAGFNAFSGNALEVQLNSPFGVATTDGKVVYISSRDNMVVMKLNLTSNEITTVAGNGPFGYGTIGNTPNSATQTKLVPVKAKPISSSTLLIADSYNSVLRKVDLPTNTISTVAGKLYETNYNGDNLLPTETLFSTVYGFAVNTTNSIGDEVYIVDIYNHLIRKMSLGNHFNVTNIAGTPRSPGSSGDNVPALSALLESPQDVSVVGNFVYICDTSSHAVRKVDVTTGIITTVAGILGQAGFSGDGELAINAQLNFPNQIFVSSFTQEVYISDTINHAIRKVFTNGTITSVVGTGVEGYSVDGTVATQADISSPTGLFVNDKNEIYFADSSQTIRKVGTDGKLVTIMGVPKIPGISKDGQNLKQVLLNGVYDLFVMEATNEYIVTDYSNTVRRIKVVNGTTTIPPRSSSTGKIITADANSGHAYALLCLFVTVSIGLLF